MKRTALRSVSVKRARQNRAYTELRRAWLQAHPACGYPDCPSPATEVHHRKGRGGALLLDVTHWTALCSAHHRRVTEWPAEAYALGLSEHRTGAA